MCAAASWWARLDRTVIYIGSFSKMLFPSLRIGYLVLPQQWVPVFARAKWLVDRQLPLLEQHVLADFIEEGHLERHLRRMRLHYDHNRQVLVQALNVHLGDRATILGENAGIHLMVRLHTNLSDEEIICRASQIRSFYLVILHLQYNNFKKVSADWLMFWLRQMLIHLDYFGYELENCLPPQNRVAPISEFLLRGVVRQASVGKMACVMPGPGCRS